MEERISKKEQEKELINFKNNIDAGIISGIIVAIAILVYSTILSETRLLPMAILGGIVVLLILYLLFVTRPINRERSIIHAKKIKFKKWNYKK